MSFLAMINLIFILFFASCNFFDTTRKIQVVHFNIKELDSAKIQKNKAPEQIAGVKKILAGIRPDILSINEIQYDTPGAPSPDYKSKGQNLRKLDELLNLSMKYSYFLPANTGLKARKKNNRYISMADPEWRNYADPVNFGILPGQYSTALMSKFPIDQSRSIQTLKWKDFNPELNLSAFKDAQGNNFPQDMPLFDKNFNHVLLNIHGKKIHFILLHTVPAYGFGNPKTPNLKRNADQLRFLEWYLTGKTDIKMSDIILKSIKPLYLDKEASFIALGDWNVDINSDKEGGKVLRSLFKSPNVKSAFDFNDKAQTNYKLGNQDVFLDYIAHSKNLKLTKASVLNKENFPSLKEEIHKASDHKALWTEFIIE